MRALFLLLTIGCLGALSAQDRIMSWEAKLSTDSLLMGNRLKVTFLLKNADGQNFHPPSFNGFKVVMGPNQSTSMSIINGDMRREKSYSYILEPIEEGAYYIEPATIVIDGEVMETAPIKILVFPNPDGIIQQNEEQQPLHWEQLPWDPPKKKLKGKKKKKIYKI